MSSVSFYSITLTCVHTPCIRKFKSVLGLKFYLQKTSKVALHHYFYSDKKEVRMKSGFKQDCIHAPILFGMFCSHNCTMFRQVAIANGAYYLIRKCIV